MNNSLLGILFSSFLQLFVYVFKVSFVALSYI